MPVQAPAREGIAHDVDVSLDIMIGALLTIGKFASRLFRRDTLPAPCGHAGAASKDSDRDWDKNLFHGEFRSCNNRIDGPPAGFLTWINEPRRANGTSPRGPGHRD